MVGRTIFVVALFSLESSQPLDETRIAVMSWLSRSRRARRMSMVSYQWRILAGDGGRMLVALHRLPRKIEQSPRKSGYPSTLWIGIPRRGNVGSRANKPTIQKTSVMSLYYVVYGGLRLGMSQSSFIIIFLKSIVNCSVLAGSTS